MDKRHDRPRGDTSLSPWIADLPAAQMRDREFNEIQVRIGELPTLACRNQDKAYRLWSELEWALRLVSEIGTPSLLNDADPEVLDAFRQFCAARDGLARRKDLHFSSRPGPYTLVAAHGNRMLMAALIKVAGRLVFAEDRARLVALFCEVCQPNWDQVSPAVFEPRTQPVFQIHGNRHLTTLPNVFRACGMPDRSAWMQRTSRRQDWKRDRRAPTAARHTRRSL